MTPKEFAAFLKQAKESAAKSLSTVSKADRAQLGTKRYKPKEAK